jgi:hypothetical protein
MSIVQISNAQIPIEENTDIVGTFRNTFQSLESSHLRQGALRDQAIELVNFDMFNGQNPDNYITRETYYYLLKSARTFNKKIATWTAEDVLNAQDKSRNLTSCPISILLYQYLYIKENALTDNLITFDGNYLYDKYIDGVWQNPYDIDYLFAFAPADTIFTSSVTYSFPSELYKSNFGGTFEFDAGDGKGFQKISIGSSSITANYSSSGRHTLQLKLTSGTTILQAKSIITTAGSSSTTRTPDLPSPVIEDISATYDGVAVEGKLWSYVHHSSNELKPFIIIEGFDIDFGTSNANLINKNGYGGLSPVSSSYEMLTNEIYSYYDVFYLDLKNPEYKIEANAALMEVAIKKINALKSESNVNNIVLGSSMGGLIARYCLRDMELNGEKHETQTLICQDTPNLGANVPIGILYCAYALIDIYNQFHLNIIPTINDSVNRLTKYLYSDAAKEMLFNFVNERGNIDNSVHSNFMEKIHQMGYPIGDDGMMRNLAISNGNDQSWPNNKPLLEANLDCGLNQLGELLINLTGGIVGTALGVLTSSYINAILGFIPGSSNISAYALVQPNGAISSNCLTYLSITYTKKLFWIAEVKNHIYKYTKNMPPISELNYDKAYCSYFYPRMAKLDDYGDQYLCYDGSAYETDLIDVTANFKIASHIPFIPTASALDIGEWSTPLQQSDLTKKYTMEARPSSPKQTPFDAYYVTPKSEDNVMFSTNILNWLSKQLQIHIEGDIIASNNSQYYLANAPSDADITWSVSDESIATIDENGILSAKSHGNIKVEALYNQQKFVKYVMVDLPSYYINVDDYSNSLCLSCLPINESETDFEIFKPYIGIQCSEYPISFKLLDSYYYYLNKSETGENQSVYFRPTYIRKDNSTKYGDVIGTTVCTAYPYTLSPNYFGYSQLGFNQIAITKNPYYTNDLNDNQKIYYFESHGGTPLSPNGDTSLTIEAENVFSDSQIQSFKSSNLKSLTNDFILRGQKGNAIQSFKVPLIR